jgi:predicted metal-dependent hydrolase
MPATGGRLPLMRSSMLDATTQLPLWSDVDPRDSWVVRESRRARRLAVRVFQTGRVEIVVPLRTSRGAVERFVARHRRWIERKRAEALDRSPSIIEPFPPHAIALPACGESWRIHLTGGTGRARLECISGSISVAGDCRNTRAVRQLLRRWLIARAGAILGAELTRCARELGFSYERVIVRRQRTRWGSCSARGTVSLNCCLLFQRPEVVRYLLIHELAHTRHLNHSRRFWQCVAEHCPEHRVLDRELLDGWRHVPFWVFGES